MTRANLLLILVMALFLALGASGLGAWAARRAPGPEAPPAPQLNSHAQPVRIVAKPKAREATMMAEAQALAGQVEESKKRINISIEGLKNLAVCGGAEAKERLTELTQLLSQLSNPTDPSDTGAEIAETQKKWGNALADLKTAAEAASSQVPDPGFSGAAPSPPDLLGKQELWAIVKPQPGEAFFVNANGNEARNIDFVWVAPSGEAGFWVSKDEQEAAAPTELGFVAGGVVFPAAKLSVVMPTVSQWLAAHKESEPLQIENMDGGYGEWVLDAGEKKVIGRSENPFGLKEPVDGWMAATEKDKRVKAPRKGAAEGNPYNTLPSVWKKLGSMPENERNSLGVPAGQGPANAYVERNWRDLGGKLWQKEQDARQKSQAENDFRYRWLLPENGITINVDLESGGGAS